MAPTVSDGGGAGDRYRRAQRGLTRLLVRDMGRLRRFLNVSRPARSFPDWLAASDEVVAQYGEMSATLAAEFFDAQRDAAGVPGNFTAPLADRPPPEQVESSLRWAMHGLWQPVDEDTTTPEERLDAAERQAEAVAQKLVADQGRETIRQAAQQDRQAVGYARAAALGACSFCKLMAARGMVYKTAGTAGRDANDRFSGDASVAKFHNDCHCAIVTVFRGQQFELSPHAANWDRIYREYAQGHPGDQLRRFRRALAEHDPNPLP